MKERPPQIQKAILEGDHEHLRNAAKKGGEATALKHDIENTKRDIAAELKELEEWQRRVNANEHIIDPDGIDQDFDNTKDD